MILVGIYNVLTSNAVVPRELTFLSQVVIGSAIGLNFTPDIFRLLSKLIIPSIIVVTGLLLMSVVLGLILHRFTDLDIATSLFATSPGALTSMAALTEAHDAQGHIVVLFHTLRLISVVTFMPILINICFRLIKFFSS